MKMKKLLAGLLSAAMVVTSVSFGGFGLNEVEAAVETETETVDVFTEYTGELATISTNSENSVNGKDGPAVWAFDNEDRWWHSNYVGGSIQLNQYFRNTDQNVGGDQNVNNRIWIQTGFPTPQNLVGFSYTSRGGTANNQIREYEVWVTSNNTADATVDEAHGWKKVADNKFYAVNAGTEQKVRFSETASNVKWIRLIAKNVYTENANGANGYVAAKRIRFYTGITTREENLNNYGKFWEAQEANGTLATQTAEDRWRFEFKDANGWKEFKGAYGTLEEGRFVGSWELKDPNNNVMPNISKDGFRQQLVAANHANALTWVAPEAGYYKFEQPNTAGTRSVAGDLKVYLVKNNQTTEDGTLLESGVNKNTGAPFQTKIQKMEAGDRFRFASVRGNGVNNYCDGNPTVTWQATPCTVREYATQYMAEVALNAEKPKALQDDVTEVKDALKALVDATETTDATIEQGIKDLEDAVARMNNYKGMTSVTITNGVTQTLNINESLTLNATTEPADYSEVEWTFKTVTGTDVVTQDTVNKNQFTAKAPGKVTIKATSVYDNTKSAEVTVIVKADTKELEAKIKEAEGYAKGSYTQASLEFLNATLGEARNVRDNEESTVDQINDVIKALDEAIKGLDVLYTVNVTGGKLADGTTTAAVVATTELTVTANPAPEGQKFSHWTVNGTPICYAETYTFNVHYDIEVAAVYVANVAEVKPEATIVCNVEANQATKVIKFTAKRSLPEGAVMKEHGMVMTNQTVWSSLYENNVEAFKLGAARTLTKKATTTGLLGNFSVSMRCKKANTWYAKGYVIYTYGDKEYTLYSNLVSDSIN